MAKSKKTRVNIKPVADKYSMSGETIIEFYDETSRAGGLISFRSTDDGKLIVDLYRLDAAVEVRCDEPQPAVVK